MKTVLAIFFLGALCSPVFSQENQDQPFRGFRGNELLAFNAGQFSQHKAQVTSDVPGYDRTTLFQIPGNSYFVINSAVQQSAALFNEMGDQLLLINLSSGENHLDLSDFPSGNYFLLDTTFGKFISKLVYIK